MNTDCDKMKLSLNGERLSLWLWTWCHNWCIIKGSIPSCDIIYLWTLWLPSQLKHITLTKHSDYVDLVRLLKFIYLFIYYYYSLDLFFKFWFAI